MESSLLPLRAPVHPPAGKQPARHTTPLTSTAQESLNTALHTTRSPSHTHAHCTLCHQHSHALRIIARARILPLRSPYTRPVTFRPTTPGHTAEPDPLAPRHHHHWPESDSAPSHTQHRHCRPYAKSDPVTTISLRSFTPRCRTHPSIRHLRRHRTPLLTRYASRWLAVRQGLCRLP